MPGGGSRFEIYNPTPCDSFQLEGCTVVRGDLLELKPENLDRILAINLRGTVFLSQAVATAMLAATRAEVVILPGNHDPATPDAVFHQIERLPNLHIMGVTSPASLHFDELDLHLWGAPHTAYADMSPLNR